jgi:hypothetical protein
MANLDHVLAQLRDERGRAQQQLEKLESAISVLEGLGNENSSHTARTSSRSGRVVSASARRRMAQAQRARWARVRASSTNRKPAGRRRATRVLSIEARRKIAAAQKARWARFRAQRKLAA